MGEDVSPYTPDELDEDKVPTAEEQEDNAYWEEIARLENIDAESFDYWEIGDREDNA